MIPPTIDKDNIDKFRTGVYPNVEHITWKVPYLDDDVLENFPNVNNFDCSDNHLSSLIGLSKLPKLKTLVFDNNIIRNFEDLRECINLEVIMCSGNFRTFIHYHSHIN